MKIVEGDLTLEQAADILKNMTVNDIDILMEDRIQAEKEVAKEEGFQKGFLKGERKNRIAVAKPGLRTTSS
ncbi:MAG: hypothetical protein LBR53_11295 [Deltaproteobacteria bacterium]|nr:hypothetical protein [Deltaproteobacteria bacterium]